MPGGNIHLSSNVALDFNFQPLIKIGYWDHLDRFSVISSPILEFYVDDDVEIYCQVSGGTHQKIDTAYSPYDLTDVDIYVNIYKGPWTEDEDILYEFSEDDNVEKVNPTQGFFKIILENSKVRELEPGHHQFVIIFTKNDKEKVVLKNFIEIIDS